MHIEYLPDQSWKDRKGAVFFETTLTAERIEATKASGFWPDQPIRESLLAGEPGKTAIVDPRRQLSYEALLEEAEALACGLLELGVRPRDVVQVQLPNWVEFVVAMVALERIGAVINPVGPIFRRNEVLVMSGLARPKAVITTSDFRSFDYAAMHVDIREQLDFIDHIIVVGEERADTRSWDNVVELGRDSGIGGDTLDLLTPGCDEVIEIIFTSGTTGQPKGVLHTINTLTEGVNAVLPNFSHGSDEVVHMGSTFAHQTGFLFGARLPLVVGGTGVYQDIWDAAVFADLIETMGVTASCGATPFLADLLAVPGLDDRDLSSFTTFGCFGAAIPLPLLEDAAERLPCAVMPGWGMSEISLMTTTKLSDPIEKLSGTDGAPLAGNEIRVVDEDGEPVEPGVVGDLEARGTFEFVGYLQGRAFTESFYSDDGWFDTGDRAVLDDDGYVRIAGRTKDLVIRGGENVPVKQVEDVLLRHPAVAGVAIVAKPHERLGEIGAAFVIRAEGGDGPTLSDLTAHLEDQDVTRQFWPEELHLVDEFPLTASGKIQKFRLRDMLG